MREAQALSTGLYRLFVLSNLVEREGQIAVCASTLRCTCRRCVRIRKARRGDVEAYNLLISRWERRIYNYLLRIVANREDALDLSQDDFLKAYQNLRKLDDPARFAPWLYRIAHNEAYSLFRKRRPEGETEELHPETLEGAATVGGNAVSRGVGPGPIYIRLE
jgi:hypothetical protein